MVSNLISKHQANQKPKLLLATLELKHSQNKIKLLAAALKLRHHTTNCKPWKKECGRLKCWLLGRTLTNYTSLDDARIVLSFSCHFQPSRLFISAVNLAQSVAIGTPNAKVMSSNFKFSFFPHCSALLVSIRSVLSNLKAHTFKIAAFFVRSAATQKHIISWQTADDSSITTMNWYTKLYVCSFEHTSSSYVERRSNWSITFFGHFNIASM